MSEKKPENRIRLAFKILLLAFCGLWIAFIFGNSLKTGTESTAQSATVVEMVQAVVEVFAPNSPIVTATGEEYQRLHAVVRTLAHFAEFALLGALFCWCYFAYTFRLKFCYLPIVGILCIPFIDELLQKFTAARACSLLDVVVDIAGGVCGLVFALLTVWIGREIYRKLKRNKLSMYENNQE